MKKIIISRVDNIGDVILTLPLSTLIKKKYPDVKILFLAKSYTKAIVELSNSIDEFIDWTELEKLSKSEQIYHFKSLNADAIIHVYAHKQIARIAKKAKISIRLGTSHKFYHLFTCNKKVNFSRRKSELHESQLNFKLLAPLGIKENIPLESIPELYNLKELKTIQKVKNLIPESENKFNLILHPKSKGSAREWGLENFSGLIRILPKGKFNIFITGTKEESGLMTDFLAEHQDRIINLTGKLNLAELIQFIHIADGLIAASTGPLHIAAALNKITIGIFAPMRPIHPERWGPVGKEASYLVLNKICKKCKNDTHCECITSITPEMVLNELNRYISQPPI